MLITGRDVIPRMKFWSAERIWKILTSFTSATTVKKNSDEPSLLSSDYRTGEVALLLTLSVRLRTLRYGVLPLSAEITTIKKSISWEDVVNNSLGAIMIDLENVLEAGVVDKGSVLQNNSFHT